MPDALHDIGHLPGIELVEPGLEDLTAGRRTVHALLLMIASSRLRALGFDVRATPPHEDCAELQLYRMLCATPGEEDPYRTYNAMVRRLDRFLRAADQHRARVSRRDRP